MQVCFDIIALEFADSKKGSDMLELWQYTGVKGGASMLYHAQWNIIIDFFFIIGYVVVLIMVSYHLMKLESRKRVNALLRGCF